jgi:predicted PurR-regulated permease PerM
MPIVKASNETASIQSADDSINQAFTNVLAAEKAGADVTQLLTKLNAAGAFLAEANNAYQTGNLSNSTSAADDARLIANQVNSDAIGLRNSSVTQSQNNTFLTVIFSVGAAFIFVVLMLLVWRRFKRGFSWKLLASKPTVVDNAA